MNFRLQQINIQNISRFLPENRKKKETVSKNIINLFVGKICKRQSQK
jgi:hypothetical protein